jgi:hypothetical protein
MEQAMTEKGIVLMGEAAKAYVTYKYFDSILGFATVMIILGGIVFFFYKISQD